LRFRFAQRMNAATVDASFLGNGLRPRSTPGPAPFGILKSNPGGDELRIRSAEVKPPRRRH
jgi:hypothetical protein